MQVPSCTDFITRVRATSRKISGRKGANETKVWQSLFKRTNRGIHSASLSHVIQYACTLFVLVIFHSERKSHFAYNTQKDTHKCVNTGDCRNISLIPLTPTPSRLVRAGKIAFLSATLHWQKYHFPLAQVYRKLAQADFKLYPTAQDII